MPKPMSKEKIIAAIKGTGGIITDIADKLSLSWHMAYDTVQMYPETILALEDEKEKRLDLAETTITKAISEGDVQTSKWLLMTIGKKRGYSEKQEMEISGQGQLVIVRGNKPTT
jgi:hypothetical protein